MRLPGGPGGHPFANRVPAGVDHRDKVCWEKDLDPLRVRDDFKKLLAGLEAKFTPKKETLPPPRADK